MKLRLVKNVTQNSVAEKTQFKYNSYSSSGRGFLLLAKTKHKNPYSFPTKEKRSKRGILLCTSINGGLPNSCNKATVILHESLSLAVVNCE
jgi:hypothetical protein